MKKLFAIAILASVFTSCMKGEQVDLIIHNAKIHTMNESNEVVQAMAIRDGEIIELGPERQLLNKYSAEEYIDATGRDVFPGFADAHGHMLSYARMKCSADLVGTGSMEEILYRLDKYNSKKSPRVIVGRGWDQSLWSDKRLPSNAALNKSYPNKGVALTRIDGHAMLVNAYLLKKANITAATQVEGGQILVENGEPTGLLLDNAIELVKPFIPDFSSKELTAALTEIEGELFQYGITDVHEAGLTHADFLLLRKLCQKKTLQIGIYGMLYPEDANIKYAKQHGFLTTDNFTVRSFKIMGDGALGSRGAKLKQAYSDDPHNHGVSMLTPELMEKMAQVGALTGYQMNVHAIGDQTNRTVLDWIIASNKENPDHRWRLEHAQVIDPADFNLIASSGVYPSVQPTHAVSDQRWAQDRLGKDRLKGAYAYKTLLHKAGFLAIGTDFPVEKIDPFLTLFAAVKRKDANNEPINGFLPEEAISVEECLRGMTIWAAWASFQELKKGSLEKKKEATFFILDQPFRVGESFEPNFAYKTFIRGKCVYSMD